VLFTLWKQHGYIDQWRRTNPWAILGEVTASLIAMVFQPGLVVICCWGYPERSLVKAAQTIRTFTPRLAFGVEWVEPTM